LNNHFEIIPQIADSQQPIVQHHDPEHAAAIAGACLATLASVAGPQATVLMIQAGPMARKYLLI